MDNQTLLYDGTKKLPDVFSQENIEKIIHTIKDSRAYLNNEWGNWERARDLCLFMTIYALALRPKEACKLKFSDFNFHDATIKINGNNNKTGKDRILPIPQTLIPFYWDYFAYDRTYYWKGSEYLFPSQANDHISPARWKMIMREKILKPAGIYIVGKTRSYTLRHTKATEILNKTNDIFLVANVLGHAKLDSTKVYLHKSPSYMNYMRSNML